MTLAAACGGKSHSLAGLDGGSGSGGGQGGGSPGTAGVGTDAGGVDSLIGVAGANGGAGATALGLASPTWRLTNAEYANTVRDLLGPWASFTTALQPDARVGGYRVGGGAGEAEALDYHAAAVELAAQAVARLPDVLPCAPGPFACAVQFVDTFAARAFRGRLDGERRTSLLALHATVSAQLDFAAGIQAVIERVLQSPYFLYHLELEEQAGAPGRVPVSSVSMASRLSYLLWATMPDDALSAKAAAGQLATPGDVRAEATRMLEDPRARVGLRNFYEQWMQLPDVPPAKRAPYAALFTPAIAAAARASFDAQMDAALWAPQGSLAQLLAKDERAGILGHPALMSMLATDVGTNPMRRGAFIYSQILCQSVPPPPTNTPPFAAVVSLQSVRQQVEGLTAAQPCTGCHVRIDPLGLLFEGFDTVGARRSVDDIGSPVNTQVTLTGTGDPLLDQPTAGPADFADHLSRSDTVARCLTSQLYRYASRRWPAATDGAAMDAMARAFASSGQSVKALLLALTQTDAFLYRTTEP